MNSTVSAALRKILPRVVVDRIRQWRLRRLRMANADRPIAEVFGEIYARNMWGSEDGDSLSGSGSTPSQAAAYSDFVREFVARHAIRTVVDLGCGDYRVGRMLRVPGVKYVGVDIVPTVIERNRARHGDDLTEFICLDFLRDPAPPGDLCLVRQVLQHLSNAEIATALKRLGGYRFALVTEHLPAPDSLTVPNLDKPHGSDTRVVDGSGVFLDRPPFSMRVEIALESPVEAPLAEPGEILRTVLLVGGP